MGEMPARTTDAALDTPSGPRPEIDAGAGPAMEERLTSWLLRAGLAFVLSYAATASLLHPATFARYFPSFLPATWTDRLLPAFAVFETLLAVALLTDRYAYVASILAGLTMVAIVTVNPHDFDVLFRNVAIACAAFALAVQCRGERVPLRISGGVDEDHLDVVDGAQGVRHVTDG